MAAVTSDRHIFAAASSYAAVSAAARLTSFAHWITLSFRSPKVLHQTLNPTAQLWCKTLSRIKVDLVLHRT